MAKFDAWVVAAAILCRNLYNMHYSDIAKAVMDTELSTLGEKGRTPAQSMGVILRKAVYHDKPVFEEQGDGHYGLCDKKWTLQLNPVQEVIRRLDAPE
ncbi:MAG: hypothetical protein ACYSUQ_07355 [Planctomycetota bacterium]|jgi:hypothetical protein